MPSSARTSVGNPKSPSWFAPAARRAAGAVRGTAAALPWRPRDRRAALPRGKSARARCPGPGRCRRARRGSSGPRLRTRKTCDGPAPRHPCAWPLPRLWGWRGCWIDRGSGAVAGRGVGLPGAPPSRARAAPGRRGATGVQREAGSLVRRTGPRPRRDQASPTEQAQLHALAARGPAGTQLAPGAPLYVMNLVRVYRARS